MSQRFRGKSVFVTGAGSGMGRAHCLALAAEGARVWVTDVDSDAALAVANQIADQGGSARALRLDVSAPSAWADAAAAVSASGPLHGLVNNAGLSFRRGIVDTSIEEWHRILEVNLSSVFYGMKFLAGSLAETAGASIVNVSSIAGMLGYFSASYGASKWGVRGLSKVAALEFADRGIRVNSIHPGLVDTPLLHSGDDSFVTESLRSVPAGRVASAEELSDAVLFLLSDEARYITGTEIVIDGGLTSGGLYHRVLSELSGASR